MIRTLLLLLIAALLPACKLHVIALKGGEVLTAGSGACLEQSNCVYEVDGTSYSESFTASPASGYQFVKWYGGTADFLCGNSTNPTCVVNLTPLAGIVPDASIVALGDGYLMPIFSDRVPITDTLTDNGLEWAQPDLFLNLSWNDIDAICPLSNGGVCNGSLNGWDMNGWTWASVDDVNALFTTYISPAIIGPGPGMVVAAGSTWAPAFFDTGWRLTATGGTQRVLYAWTRIPAGGDAYAGMMYDYYSDSQPDQASTNERYAKSFATSNLGAFFFR